MSPKIRAILFDLGDTVIQYGDVDRDALFKQGAWRTYQLWAKREQRMPDFRRYYLHQWFALRWGFFKLLLLGHERDAMRAIRRACRKLWLLAPDDFYNELAWHWYRPLAEVASVEPGTREALEELRGRGYRMAIVSNTFVPGFVLDRHLAEVGLLEFFPERVYSCEVGFRKPDRRIFDTALSRVGVAPAEAVFVGDLFKADIRGAERAGMIPIWKRRDGGAGAGGALTIQRLAELPGKIAGLEAALDQPRWLSA